tara:strand:+ start:771 stop:992 length:222 start_codon:yes stop_codon:yes gene_type:complete
MVDSALSAELLAEPPQAFLFFLEHQSRIANMSAENGTLGQLTEKLKIDTKQLPQLKNISLLFKTIHQICKFSL